MSVWWVQWRSALGDVEREHGRRGFTLGGGDVGDDEVGGDEAGERGVRLWRGRSPTGHAEVAEHMGARFAKASSNAYASVAMEESSRTLEIYRIYVETADHVSQRRALANSFFLALHTGLFAFAAGITAFSVGRVPQEAIGLVVGSFGIGLAVVWWWILGSYQKINTAKFTVIRHIEQQLPLAPYSEEWDLIGTATQPKGYTPLTKVERWVPAVFTAGYLAAGSVAAWLLME